MSKETDSELKIGINLDTSGLPAQAATAETEVRDAVTRVTDALEKQGEAAQETGQQHRQAAAAAGKNWEQAAASSGKGAEKLQGSAKGIAGAFDRANLAIDGVARALSVVGKVSGIVAAISAVAMVAKALADKFSEMATTAKSAGERVRDVWQAEQERTKIKRAQEAPLTALKNQIAQHERLIKVLGEEAALAARIREFDAMAAQNQEAAELARLERKLILNEITDAEFTAGRRELEDRARLRAQANAERTADEQLAAARQTAQHKADESAAASWQLRDFEQRMAAFGMQGGDASGFADRVKQLLDLEEQIRDMSNAYSVAPTANWTHWEQLNALKCQRDDLSQMLTGAATAVGISPTRPDKEGNQIPMDKVELLNETTRVYQGHLAKLTEASRAAATAMQTAAAAVPGAQAEADGLRDVHRAENEHVAATRAKEDAKAWQDAQARAEKAQKDAEAARLVAEKAEEEVARASTRGALDTKLSGSREQQQTLSEALTRALSALTETARPEQEGAIKNLSGLIERAKNDPALANALHGITTGNKVQLTKSQSKRWGDDLTALRRGNWEEEQVESIRSIVETLVKLNAASRRIKTLTTQLTKLDRQDKTNALHDKQESAAAARRQAEESAAAVPDAPTPPVPPPSTAALERGTEALQASSSRLTQCSETAGSELTLIAGYVEQMANAVVSQHNNSQNALATIRALANRVKRLETQSYNNVA